MERLPEFYKKFPLLGPASRAMNDAGDGRRFSSMVTMDGRKVLPAKRDDNIREAAMVPHHAAARTATIVMGISVNFSSPRP
jgi:hypothetical protein